MKWTILYFYHDQPINIQSLQNTNSCHQIIPIKLDQKSKEINWYNADRFYVNHIRELIADIKHENVLMVEWDVLINKEILNIDYSGVFCKNSFTQQIAPNWYWWHEINNLPDYLQQYAHGIAPFALIGIKKHILLELIDPKWDELFNQHIFSEIRFGTIINYLGHKIDSWPKELDQNSLMDHDIHLHNIELTKIGIFHPVKEPIAT